jgi:hypothetical protein
MRFTTVYAGAAILGLGLGLGSGCSGRIGIGTEDPNNPLGSGAAGNTGAGRGGSGPGTGTGNTGVSGTAGAGDDTPIPGQFDLSGSPSYYRVIKLTNAQWAKAVQQVLNLPAPSGLEQVFESPVTVNRRFSNNELALGMDARNWQDFQSASETLAAQVTATDAALAKVYTGTDPAGFITTLGRRIYRRALTSAEQSTYMTLYGQGSSLMGTRSTFAKGASLVLRAMLQSPYFLYRTELGAKGAPLNGYEIAAKLSLWLRGAPPDDATLDSAAGPGKLDTADGAAALAMKMLADPAATAAMRQFHGEWLHFSDFESLTRMVAGYSEALNPEFEESSYRYFDDIFSQGLGLKDILLSTKGYYGPKMAPLYGLSAPAAGTYAQADFGAQRVGWFSQVPYLTYFGIDDHNEPESILRGVSLNLDVICATLGPPAPTIPPLPPLKPGETNRQNVDMHTGTCGMACHNNMINPLGFSFEHFDGLGQYRDTENGGLTIDSSGKYTFADGTVKTWNDGPGLMQVLASTPQTHMCYAKKLASYGLQRDIVASDMPLLTSLASASMAQGGSVKQLIVSLVKSDAFRTHGGPQ